MAELVERTTHRRRGAELRLDDDDVPRGRHLSAELAEDVLECIARIRTPNRVRQHVTRASELIVRLLEPELAHVT